MNKVKRIASLFLCGMLITGLFSMGMRTTVYAEGIEVTSLEELNQALTSTEYGSEYTIELGADIDVQSSSFSVPGGKKITLIGNGHTLSNVNTVHVSGQSTLNLGDGSTGLTISGITNNDSPGIVEISGEGTTVNMYEGVTLKDHTGNNYYGGGVTNNGGIFHMYGGVIENCGIKGGSNAFGGGVAVLAGGQFIMDGGTIRNCFVDSSYGSSWQTPNVAGGGVVVHAGSSFIMNNGTIDNNFAGNSNGFNTSAVGGGIAIVTSLESIYAHGNYGYLDSALEINGGTISNNHADAAGGGIAGGLAYIDSYAIGTPTSISSNPNDPGIRINGGTITRNEAEGNGGGIFLNWIRTPVVTISNVEISENIASAGGGLYTLSYWTRTVISNTTFTNNSAEYGEGGAVGVTENESGGYLTLNEVTMTGNTAKDPDDTSNTNPLGGGVYYDAKSTVNLTGKNNITENTYNGLANNLNVLDAKVVNVTGDLSGSQIGISDPKLWSDGLSDTDEAAVSKDGLTNGYTSTNTALPKEVFVSDHESWRADYSTSGTEVRLIRPTYTVIWKNDDGTVLETDENVAYGTTPVYDGETPSKEESDGYAYTFKGWNPEIGPVTDDVVYIAMYDAEKVLFTVTWADEDGTVLQTDENVRVGTVPSYSGATPTKEEKDGYRYTFKGWSPEVGPVSEDVIYTAQYTAEQIFYTVTWVNDDGSVLELDENVTYGTVPSYDGETPVKEATAQYTYIFTGWDPTVEAVTKNITYTAQYEAVLNTYTITWINEDGTVLAVDEAVPYGTLPSYNGSTPVKAETADETYTFRGWSPAVREVSGDMIYRALFTAASKNKDPQTPSATPWPQAQTCQDVGYPSDYAWNEEVKACVPYGTNRIPVVNTAAK